MSSETPREVTRFCVKIYAPEPFPPKDDAAAYVPVFHDWIRDSAIEELLLFDVADYAHVPDGPGIVLVAHEATFSLDRSDGRFGLLGQRRFGYSGAPADALIALLRQTVQVATKLEADPRLFGKLKFERRAIRIEANDRLHAPNSDAGYEAILPIIQQALGSLGFVGEIERVENDPRNRLAVDVTLANAVESHPVGAGV